MRLKKEILIIEEIGAALVDDDQVGRAEDDQVDGLQGGDHHLVDSAGYEDEEHAVGEILENKYFSTSEASPRYLQL